MKNRSRSGRDERGETITLEFAGSSLGTVLVGTTRKGIRYVQLGDNADSLRDEFMRQVPGTTTVSGGTPQDQIAREVGRFIDEPGTALEAPLDVRGTEFQRTVWRALQEIPSGSTLSYTELAAETGRPSSTRAVARACASNDLAVIIPCHRAIRGDGSLAGYRWGLERKRALLEREASASRRTLAVLTDGE